MQLTRKHKNSRKSGSTHQQIVRRALLAGAGQLAFPATSFACENSMYDVIPTDGVYVDIMVLFFSIMSMQIVAMVWSLKPRRFRAMKVILNVVAAIFFIYAWAALFADLSLVAIRIGLLTDWSPSLLAVVFIPLSLALCIACVAILVKIEQTLTNRRERRLHNKICLTTHFET